MNNDGVPTTTRERVATLLGIAAKLTSDLRKHGDLVDYMAADVIRMGLHVLLETDLKEETK